MSNVLRSIYCSQIDCNSPHEHEARASQLTSLLVDLNGGKPLDLTVAAAIGAAAKGTSESTTSNEILSSTLQQLFADHVGRSPENIIENAFNFIDTIYSLEVDLFNETQERCGNEPVWASDVNQMLFDCPWQPLVRGPRLDALVWLEMFLGKDRMKALLDGTVPFRTLHEADKNTQPREFVWWSAIKEEVPRLPLCELMVNILSYVRTKSEEYGEDNIHSLLRFAVLYGLDGVMKDVLKGAYGIAPENFTVDTLIPLDEEETSDEWSQKYWLPALHLGAIVGHSNIVLTALKDLGADINAPMGIEQNGQVHVRVNFSHACALRWVILKNNKGMLHTLITDCKFQFRWLERDCDSKLSICQRIFELSEYEAHPEWKGGIKTEDYLFEGSRVRSQMRAASAYKEQMIMLDYMIDLGLPFELLFPVEPKVDEMDHLQKENKLQSRQQEREYIKSLNKTERAAFNFLGEIASSYNYVQSQEDAHNDEDDDFEQDNRTNSKLLTLGDYYRMFKNKWDGKETQVYRLPEFEASDPSWRDEMRRCEQDSDGVSDDDTDDFIEEYG